MITATRSVALLSAVLVTAGCEDDTVDAYYYPDKNDLSQHRSFLDVGSVEKCRVAVFHAATLNGDPRMLRGDYECAIGRTGDSLGDIKIYRETVK